MVAQLIPMTEKVDIDNLRQYQLEGVRFLIERNSALLADEMGLGKTVQAAVAIRHLILTREIDRALVIVPSSLKLNWQLEINKWFQ